MTPRELAMAILETEPKEDDLSSISIALTFERIGNPSSFPDIYARYKIRINYINGEFVELGKLEPVGYLR